MKVNMNNSPEPKQTDIPAEPETAEETVSVPENGAENDKAADPQKSEENIYLVGLKEYKDKFKKEAKEKGFFRTTKFWIILIIVLFIMFLSANNKMSAKSARLQSQIRHTNTEIGKLDTAVTDFKIELDEQAKIDSITLSQEEEDLARNDAKVQGAMVADLQNKYLEIDKEYMPQIIEIEAELNDLNEKEDTSENRTKINELEQKEKDLDSAKYSENTEVKGRLDAYFDENGKRSGKGIWYSYNTTGIPGKWEFATNATFKGSTTRVLWLCYAKDRSLLAYATSKYNADTKLFSDVIIDLTSYAEANINNDSDMIEKSAGNDENLSIAEQLQKLVEDGELLPSTDPADQEFDQETIDTNNELSDTRDEYEGLVSSGQVEGEEYNTNYITGLPGQGSDAPQNTNDGRGNNNAQPE